MVISNIKLGFGRKKVAALPRKFSLNGQADSVKRVCVVSDEADAGLINKFTNLREDLKISENDFKMLFCLSSGAKQEISEGIIFIPADLTWSGRIKNAEVEGLLKEQWDLLIYFTGREIKTVHFIASALQANLKVNRNEKIASQFDLTISTDYNEVDVFIAELKKYLKNINRIKE